MPHTQGDWHSWSHVVNKKTGRIEWVVSTEEGRCIATLPAHTGDSWDAALIAAAPDLLAQLEALVVQIESSNVLIVPPNVRSAIEKARGRA